MYFFIISLIIGGAAAFAYVIRKEGGNGGDVYRIQNRM